MSDRQGTMKCSDAVRRLWDYLDRTVSPGDAERIEQHLSFCRRCCGELEFAKELQAFLASGAIEEIPADVKVRLEGFVGELER